MAANNAFNTDEWRVMRAKSDEGQVLQSHGLVQHVLSLPSLLPGYFLNLITPTLWG